jgi:tetratricopeptide (TPR) repeat protein
MPYSDSLYRLLCNDRAEEITARHERAVQQHEPLPPGAAVALALALRGRNREAKEVLAAGGVEMDPKAASMKLEAEMLIALRERRSDEEVQTLAKRAIETAGDAVFAHRLLGYWAEARRRKDEVLEHYRAAYDAAPDSPRSLADYARALIFLRRPQEALDIINKMNPSLRREIYRVWGLRRGPKVLFAAVAIAVVAGFLILAAPPVAWGLALIGCVLIAQGLRWRDGLVFAAGFRVGIFALAALLLRAFALAMTSG